MKGFVTRFEKSCDKLEFCQNKTDSRRTKIAKIDRTNLENIFFGRKFECFIKTSRAQPASAWIRSFWGNARRSRGRPWPSRSSKTRPHPILALQVKIRSETSLYILWLNYNYVFINVRHPLLQIEIFPDGNLIFFFNAWLLTTWLFTTSKQTFKPRSHRNWFCLNLLFFLNF